MLEVATESCREISYSHRSRALPITLSLSHSLTLLSLVKPSRKQTKPEPMIVPLTAVAVFVLVVSIL